MHNMATPAEALAMMNASIDGPVWQLYGASVDTQCPCNYLHLRMHILKVSYPNVCPGACCIQTFQKGFPARSKAQQVPLQLSIMKICT